MAVFILGIIAILVLLGVLVMVHKQSGKVKELEMRMKAMDDIAATNDSTTTK